MSYIRNFDKWSLGIDFSKICFVERTLNEAFDHFEIHFIGGTTLHLSTKQQRGRDFKEAWKAYSEDCQLRERVGAFQP